MKKQILKMLTAVAIITSASGLGVQADELKDCLDHLMQNYDSDVDNCHKYWVGELAGGLQNCLTNADLFKTHQTNYCNNTFGKK